MDRSDSGKKTWIALNSTSLSKDLLSTLTKSIAKGNNRTETLHRAHQKQSNCGPAGCSQVWEVDFPFQLPCMNNVDFTTQGKMTVINISKLLY